MPTGVIFHINTVDKLCLKIYTEVNSKKKKELFLYCVNYVSS
jgi:hypothetical protein